MCEGNHRVEISLLQDMYVIVRKRLPQNSYIVKLKIEIAHPPIAISSSPPPPETPPPQPPNPPPPPQTPTPPHTPPHPHPQVENSSNPNKTKQDHGHVFDWQCRTNYEYEVISRLNVPSTRVSLPTSHYKCSGRDEFHWDTA